MKLLNGKLLKQVVGASRNGGWEGYYGHSGGGYNVGHITYGGQGGGFVGTNSCEMNLGNLIKNNTCVAGVVSGALSGAAGGLSGAVRGAVIGSIGGMCYSDSKGGNGNGGGSGNYGAQCSW